MQGYDPIKSGFVSPLISKDQSIVQDFRKYFTDAQDLDEYNLEIQLRNE